MIGATALGPEYGAPPAPSQRLDPFTHWTAILSVHGDRECLAYANSLPARHTETYTRSKTRHRSPRAEAARPSNSASLRAPKPNPHAGFSYPRFASSSRRQKIVRSKFGELHVAATKTLSRNGLDELQFVDCKLAGGVTGHRRSPVESSLVPFFNPSSPSNAVCRRRHSSFDSPFSDPCLAPRLRPQAWAV